MEVTDVSLARCRVLVALRTFVGTVYLSNGLAKLFAFHDVTIGPWKSYLINSDDARAILHANVSNPDYGLGFVRDLLNSLVLRNWGAFSWIVTFGEIAVGVGLLLGILGRVAALGGFLLSFPLFVAALGQPGAWMFDYLFEPMLLALLAFTPGLPGLDGWVVRRFHARALVRGVPEVVP